MDGRRPLNAAPRSISHHRALLKQNDVTVTSARFMETGGAVVDSSSGGGGWSDLSPVGDREPKRQ